MKIPKLRKRIWILLVSVFLLVVFLLWYFIPRPLSGEAKQQLAMVAQVHSTPSKAFVYLIGMQAPDNVDPMAYGQQQLPQYVASSQYDGSEANPHAQPRMSHPLADTPFDCSLFKEAHCLESFFSEQASRQIALAQSTELLHRYMTYQSFGDLHQVYAMNVGSFMPDFGVLIGGQKVFFLQQIDAVENDQISAQAMQKSVLDDLNHWRSELTYSDTIIHKMVVVTLTRNDLFMLAKMDSKYGLHAPKINALTVQERSFRLANAAETEVGYRMQLTIQQSKCEPSQLTTCVRGRMQFPMVYDFNDSVNMEVLAKTQETQLAELPLDQAYLHKDDLPKKASFGHWFRNSVGTILAHTALIDYKEYIYRVDDLNLQITLLNATVNQQAGSSDTAWLKSITNPYGANAGHAYLNAQGWLCLPTPFKGAASTHPFDGCIPWKAV